LDNIDSLLWGTRAALHLATFLIVASYHDTGARFRLEVTTVAICLCGSSGALGMLAVTRWTPGRFGTEYNLLFLLFVLAVFVIVVKSKGNVAKMFPRIPWRYRP